MFTGELSIPAISHYTHPPTPVAFQIISDLHLELNNQYNTFKIPTRARNLILAGDIGCLKDYEQYVIFLMRHIANYMRILLVLGNHEFYGLSYSEGLEAAQRLEKEESMCGKLHVLTRENGRVDIPVSADGGERAITVLGCTLWSQVPEEKSAAVLGKVKDFQKIVDWSLEMRNAEHDKDLKWLRGEIERFEDEKQAEMGERLLVITHHAPAIEECSDPKHASNPWNSAFGTELLEEAPNNAFGNVSYWIFGHTHFTTEFKKGGVRVVSNQRGYTTPQQEGKGILNSMAAKFKKRERVGAHEFDVCKVIVV